MRVRPDGKLLQHLQKNRTKSTELVKIIVRKSGTSLNNWASQFVHINGSKCFKNVFLLNNAAAAHY